MEVEAPEAVRQAGNIQIILNKHRRSLESQPTNPDALYSLTARTLFEDLDVEFPKLIEYIQVKVDWPLAFKRLLLHHVRIYEPDNTDKLNNIANFVLNPTTNIKHEISKPTRHFHFNIPTIASIERTYGSGVCSIFHLQYRFFLMNLLTLIIWLSLITIPSKVLTNSTSLSNESFTFSTIFTTKGYLSESVLFQGSYPYGILKNKYNLTFIYLLTTYIYFFIWFVYITIRFASAYKQKVFNSILNTKLGLGFMSTFARCDYTIQLDKHKERQEKIYQRQFLDLIGNDERIKKLDSKKYRTIGYKFKIFITNLFYILLAMGLGGANWLILSFCNKPTVDCHESIIYLVLINRLMPYVIVMLTQVETNKYLSYKLNAVGFRCLCLNVSTILSFTIYFFINAPSCYETAYGQYIYILLLSDIFASLVFPLVFGLLFDITYGRKNRDFDGINLHVQLSPPALLYSQFLIWIGIYFSPLLSIMILINIFFSFISHRLYLYIRSRHAESCKRVFIWNAYRLEYMIYFLAYIILIISVTCFVVFTTQIKPSPNCGPFRHLNGSYELIEIFLNDYETSVLWVSLINFLTSPGLLYFLGVTFCIVAYKLRHEGLAEEQLVFIRENNLDNKKNIRQNVVKKLHQQQEKKDEKYGLKKRQPILTADDEDVIRTETF